MNENKLLKITLNFLAVVLLIGLIATPFFFAKNFARVAGVKSQSQFLVVSQVEKFPEMILSQEADRYQITFTKLGPSQAYLGVLIINNPTNQTQTYDLKVTSGSAQVFFGEDLNNQLTQISTPSQASVPVSLFSGQDVWSENQAVEFVLNFEN